MFLQTTTETLLPPRAKQNSKGKGERKRDDKNWLLLHDAPRCYLCSSEFLRTTIFISLLRRGDRATAKDWVGRIVPPAEQTGPEQTEQEQNLESEDVPQAEGEEQAEKEQLYNPRSSQRFFDQRTSL